MKVASAPRQKSIGTVRTTLPSMTVAMKTKSWIPVGIATASDAAEKNPSEIEGKPVVNMWCTHSPKLRKPVPIAESTIQEYPAMGRWENVGMIIASSAIAGRKMM
jgi:hypothetical protein